MTGLQGFAAGGPMSQLFAVAAGGALGAVLRFWAANAVSAWAGRDFPWGTFAVNVSGSLLIGILFVCMVEHADVSDVGRAFALTGVLGGFTTFSAFSLDTLQLIHQAEYLRAVFNVGLSVSACIAAAAIGVALARQIF